MRFKESHVTRLRLLLSSLGVQRHALLSECDRSLTRGWNMDKSGEIIFRSTEIIGTLPGIVGRGEISPKSARLSSGVFPALEIQID